MTASNTSGGLNPAPVPAAAASGPTSSPWLRILGVSAGAAAVVLVVLTVVAAVVGSAAAAFSALAGGALVMVFFAISLLIGHWVGRTNPSGAMGLFVVTYALKVVGFAVALFAIGRPDWLNGTWFFAAAVATVLAWQVAEVIAFAKTRYLLYGAADDEEESHG